MSGRRPRVAIDLVPIQPGRGGAGGGIWSYARHLVQALDAIAPDDLDIVCLARAEQRIALRHLRVVELSGGAGGLARRLLWVHGRLPRWCAAHSVSLLHKLATEVPLVLRGTRLVTTVHDFMPQYFREHLPRRSANGRSLGGALHHRYFALATHRCFARSEVVLTDSVAVAREAALRFPRARGRIEPVPLGVAPLPDAGAAVHDPADDRTRAPGAPLRLLCVGTFSPHKGQLRVVQALDALAVRAPELARTVTLAFRGFVADPAYHADVRAAAAASPLADRITFDAWERDADLARIYAGADLVLLLSSYEGFGLPLLEAQGAGVPVLCSDIAVFREVLGAAASYVPVDDAASAAVALEQLLGDPALRAERAREGRANAARFTWERTARRTLELYREVLFGRGGGGAGMRS